MALVEFSADDLKGSVLLDPAVYDAVVVHASTVMDSKEPPKPLHKYRLKVSSSNPEFDGAILFDQFSSAAMWAFVPFFEATMGIRPTPGVPFDTEAPLGRPVRVAVKRGTYNGQPKNEIAGYAPANVT